MSTLASAANRSSLALLLIALISACAKMGAPPGGPEDKDAPYVVFTSPEADALNVDVHERATIEFSEMMNRPAVEAALYLSPEPGNRLRYHWKGRRLTLEYLDTLTSNRTHVVTIGAQAKDLQGNSLTKSFTLAFSTGDHIDRGEFSGYAEIPEGMRSLSILAYSKQFPDPMTDVADYRIQTSADGTFLLGYLAPATYRVFAVADRNLDGKWSPANEIIGTASADVEVSEGKSPFVSFSPALQDTTPWTILRAKFLDLRTLNLRFNHQAQPLAEVSDDSATHYAEHFRVDTSANGSWFVYFAEGLRGDSATVSVQIAEQRLTTRCAVSHNPDTTRPSLVISNPVSGAKLRYVPHEFLAIFSEPIIFSEQTDSIHVTLRKDTTSLPLTISQTDPAGVTIIPLSELIAGVTYLLEMPASLITDYSGNAPRDSVLRMSWYSYPEDSLGSVVGNVEATVPGPWIVQLFQLGSEVPMESISTESAFTFEKYSADEFRLRVVRDLNGNERPDFGKVTPFEFSEPFFWHPETLTVRPRWETETTVVWPI